MKMHAWALALLAAATGGARAADFLVTNTDDGGAGSFRQAVFAANTTPGADTISFAVTGTITLTTGQVLISEALTINGPGSGLLTISGNNASRVLVAVTPVAMGEDICDLASADFPVAISGLTIANGVRDVANSQGGGLYSEKTLTLTDVVLTNNTAFAGGGMAFNFLYANQSLSLNNTRILDNVARPLSTTTSDSNGGGIRVTQRCAVFDGPGSVTIDDSVIAGNQTQPGGTYLNSQGGGMHFTVQEASLTIRNTRIVDNAVVTQNPAVPGANNRGGGLSVPLATFVRIERSEIAGNTASRAAGLRLINDATARQTAGEVMPVTIDNSTISGNVATTSEAGRGTGGIAVTGNVALALRNSTVFDNESLAGVGGITADVSVSAPGPGNTLAPTVALSSSIVAGSRNGAPDFGVFDEALLPAFVASGAQSLVQTLEPVVTVSGAGNLTGIAPNLGPLAFNGGFTRTHAIVVPSPVLDTGNNAQAFATDQRGAGYPRVSGAGADMGAYERLAIAPSVPVPALSGLALALLASLLGVGAWLARRRA
jgi:hypothetical protein